MALISVTGAPNDANDGQIGQNIPRIGNRTYGQRTFLSGTERPIATYAGPEPESLWQEILSKPDPLSYLSSMGRVFYASDADQNDLVTGQTSFANTTPTFVLDVPAGTVAIPLMLRLFQTGTVAGAAVDVIIEFDDADRVTSGTAETVLSSRTDQPIPPTCTFQSTVTAPSGYGVRVAGYTLGQDVSPAEGAVNEIIWAPTAGLDLLVGPAAMCVYTYAGTTGPTWFWSAKWAEFPKQWLAGSA